MNETMVTGKAAVTTSKCAAEVIDVLQNRDKLAYGEVLVRLEAALAVYDLHPDMDSLDVDELRTAARKLHTAFGATDDEAAVIFNEVLQKYASNPGVMQADGVWQLSITRNEADWSEKFIAASAMALATLLADKQRNPAGICASETCQSSYIDLGKGGGRHYCSPRCATRERVAQYRKLKKENG